MKNKNFTKNNKAVAGVIEALLIVALVAIVLSTIQLLYIPEIMKQREADHMDEVSNQFSFIKSIIDLQSGTKEDVPITSPVTLGSKEIPYFVTARGYGMLKIVEGNDYDINLDFDTLILPLTSIRYEAYNSYYTDQIYSIEGGAIIVKQPNRGGVVRIDPSITIENYTNDINIYYEIPIIKAIVGKSNSSGSDGVGIAYIRTNYSSSDSNWQSLTGVTSIRFNTEFPYAWRNLTKNLLNENVNYNIGSNYLEITEKTKQINFYYKRTYIYAQVSPGWIITPD